MKYRIASLAVLLCTFFFATCTTDDVKTGSIQFNYSPKLGARQNGDPVPAALLLSVRTSSGTSIFDMHKLPLFEFGTGYLTESVELPVGNYQLTVFLVLDSANKVIYACPQEGSEMAQYVNDPLPITFAVYDFETSTVVPQVLAVDSTDNPSAFGYANFGFEIVTPDTTDIDSLNVVYDIDGNKYSVLTIGNQKWLGENLKTTHYRNGDAIPTTSPVTLDISSETTPQYQWAYGGNEANAEIYGRLYTQFVAYDNRGVCPAGFHVPTDEEALDLIYYLIRNGYNFDHTTDSNKIGKALASDSLWQSYPYIDGVPGNHPELNNASGFNGLGAGIRVNSDNVFIGQGVIANWWTSGYTGSGHGGNVFRIQNFMIEGDWGTLGYFNSGSSIRCLKD